MDYTDEQKQALEEFRRRVGDKVPSVLCSDAEFYKWLEARNFNVNKAVAMIEKSLVYRKTWKVDSLLEWIPPDVIIKYSAVGFSGYDKEQSPVWIIPAGNCDIRGLLQSCSQFDFIRYQLQVLEKSLAMIGKQPLINGKMNQQVCIFDLDNFAMKAITWKPARDAIFQLLQLYEENYPELLKRAIVINAPMVISLILAMVKPFLQETTLNKIKIFGTSGWKEALLQMIPADQLPVHWGGTQVDPDGNEKCISKICLGGEVPKSFYLKNRALDKDKHNKTDSMLTLLLPQGEKESIIMDVPLPASTLKWEFFTDDFDVGFGISRVLNSGREEILVAQHRVNCQEIPEEGLLYCDCPGKYEIMFDNEYSYLRSKNLYYRLELLEPTDTTKL